MSELSRSCDEFPDYFVGEGMSRSWNASDRVIYRLVVDNPSDPQKPNDKLLTPRLESILTLLAADLCNKQIASQLGLKAVTVREAVSGIAASYGKTKLGLNGIAEQHLGWRPENQAGLLRAYIEMGVIKRVPIQSLDK